MVISSFFYILTLPLTMTLRLSLVLKMIPNPAQALLNLTQAPLSTSPSRSATPISDRGDRYLGFGHPRREA